MSSVSLNSIIYSAVVTLPWILLALVSHLNVGAGSTHWVVTADGRVQAQADSIFNLQCPYDVMVLLNQEKRRDLAEAIRMELLTKDTSETPDEKDTDFEKEFYASDPNCSAAGKPLIEFDFYKGFLITHDDKRLRSEDYMEAVEFEDHVTVPNKAPLCAEYVPLEFSMHSFEHLEGMIERHNLTSREELDLKQFLPYDVEKFGSFVASKLEKNTTSWIFYNLASFYWRVKGDSLQTVECLRRSLHFSPREFKDIALVSLASILHQSRRSNEAAIVLHAALEISNIFSEEHFALGNIYAVLGDFNKSVICYENALKLEKKHMEAYLRKNAVQCHIKLSLLLEQKHRSLQKTLDDLKQYQMRHETWQTMHRKMQSEQLHSEGKMKQGIFYREHLKRVKESTKEPHLSALDLHLISAHQTSKSKKIFNLEKFNSVLVKPSSSNTTVNHSKQPNSKADVTNDFPMEKPKQSQDQDFLQYIHKYLAEHQLVSLNQESHDSSGLDNVPNANVQQKVEKPRLDDDWPSESECSRNVQHFPSWSEFQTVFLSLQKKGFDIAHLLGLGQGLNEGQAHPFPWYPPLCTPPPSPSSSADIPEGLGMYDHISAVRDRASLRVKLEDPTMKEVLAMQITQSEKQEITLEEIGQRILTALKNNIGPPWILYNLAGLFWRVSGNPLNSIECIRRALNSVPHDLRDVPTVNLASVLYKVGRVKDAIKVMKDALTINYFESDSLFFMGNLLAAIGNVSGAINYYQDALGLDPTHDSALKNLRMVLCLKKFHLSHQTLASHQSGSESGSYHGANKNSEAPHTRTDDSSSEKCPKVRLEKKIPVHLYTRNGDGHFCAIPLSSEQKTSNESPREVLEGADNDDFFLHCEKIDGSGLHKIPTDLLHSLSSQDAPCNSECVHLRHIRSYRQKHQQRSIVIDLDDN